MRSIWKGSIGFGLVNIPVKLYSAVQQSTLDFDMLDNKDHAKVKYVRVNEHSGKEVEWSHIVKGFYYKNNYVVMEPEDFEAAAPEKTKIIEIKEFISEDEISPLYYETPYYLEPEKSGYSAYGLLREALKKSGKIGLSSFVLRNAEVLCLIKPLDDMIIVHRIRFPEEIKAATEFDVPRAKAIKPAEMKIALAIIKQFTGKFDEDKYEDEYTKELMKIIRQKAAGKQTKIKKLVPVKIASKDLLEQLKASLKTPPRKKAS